MDRHLLECLVGHSVELEYCPPNRPGAEVFSINQQPILWNVFGDVTLLILRETRLDPTAPKNTELSDAQTYNFIFKFLLTEHITSVRASAPAHIKVWEGTWVKESRENLYNHEKCVKSGYADAWSCRVWDMVEKALVDLGMQDEPRPSPYTAEATPENPEVVQPEPEPEVTPTPEATAETPEAPQPEAQPEVNPEPAVTPTPEPEPEPVASVNPLQG